LGTTILQLGNGKKLDHLYSNSKFDEESLQ